MSVYTITEVILDENNEPMVNEAGQVLCHVINAQGETDTIQIDKNIVNSIISIDNGPENAEAALSYPGQEGEKNDWSEEQTKYILDKYFEYLVQVGPMKRFRLKKEMWAQISLELGEIYHVNKTPAQIENRYKTVMKRKKKQVDNNKVSGAKRVKVDFEEEISKISSIDDSVEPEILIDQNTLVKNEKVSTSKRPAKTQSGKILEYLKMVNSERKEERERIHKEKEENKERRHKEKLKLLKELFTKN